MGGGANCAGAAGFPRGIGGGAEGNAVWRHSLDSLGLVTLPQRPRNGALWADLPDRSRPPVLSLFLEVL